jgi:hypothetical protein
VSELDNGIKEEFTGIGTAMRKIMVCARQMNDALSQANVLERFIWDLHHELAGILCRPIPVDSVICRLYNLYRERIQAEEDIENGIERITSFIQHMIMALSEPVLKDYLPKEYFKIIESLSRELEHFRLDVTQLRQYSSRVPRITPTEADLAVFMELRKSNPTNGSDYLKLVAYLKLEGRHIDASVKENAEQKRLRFKEDQRLSNQRFNEELNPVALRSALKDAGINTAGAK